MRQKNGQKILHYSFRGASLRIMSDDNDDAGDWRLMMMMMMVVAAKCRDDVKRDSSDYLPAGE